MNTNITAVLSPEDLAKIKANLAAIRLLLPFLLTLSKAERRKLFKMGDKSVAFVQNSLTAAQNNPEIFPPTFATAEFAKDVAITVVLSEIETLLAQLHSDVEDTLMAFGSEAINQGTDVYGYAKAAVKKKPGLKPIVEQLGARFVKGPRKKHIDKAA